MDSNGKGQAGARVGAKAVARTREGAAAGESPAPGPGPARHVGALPHRQLGHCLIVGALLDSWGMS